MSLLSFFSLLSNHGHRFSRRTIFFEFQSARLLVIGHRFLSPTNEHAHLHSTSNHGENLLLRIFYVVYLYLVVQDVFGIKTLIFLICLLAFYCASFLSSNNLCKKFKEAITQGRQSRKEVIVASFHRPAHVRESSNQPILPGLPDDLAMRCLAKIPHGYHGSLETVSKRWKDVLRSTEYSSYKAKQGWSGDWVFLLTEKSKAQWIAYDPDADRWHPIAMIPRRDEYAWCEGFGCCCVDNMFLVIGGSYCRNNPRVTGERPVMTNQVYRFDTFTKKWSEAASMKTPRAYFGCCVMSGKVYVCGGRNMSHLDGLALAEVYDPLTNKWEELPRMHNNLMDCLCLSRDGKLYAFTDQQGNGWIRNYTPLSRYRTEIFDPSNWVWRTEEMNWPCSTFGRAEVQVTEDGEMYADVHVDGELNLVKKMDNGGEWHVVAQLPSLGPPPDGSSWDKKVSENGFVALGNELYFIGGKTACNRRMGWMPVIQLVDLNRCWIWDGNWRETRPMCRPSCGGVKGFAALKEMKM